LRHRRPLRGHHRPPPEAGRPLRDRGPRPPSRRRQRGRATPPATLLALGLRLLPLPRLVAPPLGEDRPPGGRAGGLDPRRLAPLAGLDGDLRRPRAGGRGRRARHAGQGRRPPPSTPPSGSRSAPTWRSPSPARRLSPRPPPGTSARARTAASCSAWAARWGPP